jgi:E3 ubiquitin-protein ligase MARCH6
MADESKACRICHESDDPLFYPCKCSGSIKYVHAECLKQWLRINKKKKCEVCGEELSFQKEYADDAPRSKFSFPVIRELLTEWISAATYSGSAYLAFAAPIWFVPAASFLLYRLSFLLVCGCGWQRDFSDNSWPLDIWVGDVLELICVVGSVGILDVLFLRKALLVRS